MPPARRELARRPVVLRGRLRLRDRRGALESDAEVDVLAVRDPALHAAAPVRRRAEPPVRPLDEAVVVLAPGDLCPAEAGADLEGLRGGDGEHGVCEHGFEFVEDGLTEPWGHVTKYTGDRAADGVVCFFCAKNALGTLRRGFVSITDKNARK